MTATSRALGMAVVLQATMNVGMEEWKDEILEKWEASKKLPRKKKKKLRKELELEWRIASFNLLDGIGSSKIKGVVKL